jgi:hypothetical protein
VFLESNTNISNTTSAKIKIGLLIMLLQYKACSVTSLRNIGVPYRITSKEICLSRAVRSQQAAQSALADLRLA